MALDIDQGPSGQESMVASSEPAGLGLIVGAQRSGGDCALGWATLLWSLEGGVRGQEDYMGAPGPAILL